jgi:hypothetical protein
MQILQAWEHRRLLYGVLVEDDLSLFDIPKFECLGCIVGEVKILLMVVVVFIYSVDLSCISFDGNHAHVYVLWSSELVSFAH